MVLVPIVTEQAGTAALSDIPGPQGEAKDLRGLYPQLLGDAQSPGTGLLRFRACQGSTVSLQSRESKELLAKRAEGAGVGLGQDLAGVRAGWWWILVPSTCSSGRAPAVAGPGHAARVSSTRPAAV